MEKKHSRGGAADCIHCGLCQKNCAFLKKYGLDIGDTGRLEELSYSCFLCGKCTEVCPQGIDGRQIILDMRRKKAAEQGNQVSGKGYGLLLWEKKNYKFRNEKGRTPGRVLFPGCNFPSFYPETCRYLSRLLLERAGMGTVYDCCGKPVAELGLEKEEEQIRDGLEKRFEKAGIQEIVVVCPNCYHFLSGKLTGIQVTSIYQVLEELGLGKKAAMEGQLFLPCPDRESRRFLKDIRPFLEEEPRILEGVQCCGLGGCASVREPELSKGMLSSVPEETKIWTYCASCCGNFSRSGHPGTRHILAEILETGEKADTRRSLWNRFRSKYWKENVR